MDSLQKALELIKAQQEKMKRESAPWCVGEQLSDILRERPEAAETVAADLKNTGMSLADAEKKIAKFARDHRQGNAGFCGPEDADRILREFYGIEKEAEPWNPKKRKTINIADFM